MDFEIDPDEDPGPVEDEKWPLWYEPEKHEGHMGRKIGIWVFGLLASSIFGGLIGQKLDYTDGGFWGFLGGIFTFSCIRLWLSPGQTAKK